MVQCSVCPILPVLVEIWQNGHHSSLAAMAEHPIFCQQKIISDVLAHPVCVRDVNFLLAFCDRSRSEFGELHILRSGISMEKSATAQEVKKAFIFGLTRLNVKKARPFAFFHKDYGLTCYLCSRASFVCQKQRAGAGDLHV